MKFCNTFDYDQLLVYEDTFSVSSLFMALSFVGKNTNIYAQRIWDYICKFKEYCDAKTWKYVLKYSSHVSLHCITSFNFNV